MLSFAWVLLIKLKVAVSSLEGLGGLRGDLRGDLRGGPDPKTTILLHSDNLGFWRPSRRPSRRPSWEATFCTRPC